MQELKSKLEAVLFCCPVGISSRKLADACGLGSAGHVKAILAALADEYKSRGSGLEIIEGDGLWKLRVKPEHSELVKESAKPEMDTAVLETLAYIAWKGRIRQSELIKSRSNKAYKHLEELESQGLIERAKVKSTFDIKPTKKFFDYFNLKEGEALEVPRKE